MNIVEFATDPDFLGLSLEKITVQDVIIRVYYGLPVDEKQLGIFKFLTKVKDKYIPEQVKSETIFVLGAKSGKSLLISDYTILNNMGYLITLCLKKIGCLYLYCSNARASS